MSQQQDVVCPCGWQGARAINLYRPCPKCHCEAVQLGTRSSLRYAGLTETERLRIRVEHLEGILRSLGYLLIDPDPFLVEKEIATERAKARNREISSRNVAVHSPTSKVAGTDVA